MKKMKGFTLIELLVVVIIIGILAALAIPQYTKTIERAHWGEAITNLGTLRSAEIRYFAENDEYTPNAGTPAAYTGTTCAAAGGTGAGSDFGSLDVTDPNDIANARFCYDLISADVANQEFIVRAVRRVGKYAGACIALDESGNWNKGEMYDTDTACALTEATF